MIIQNKQVTDTSRFHNKLLNISFAFITLSFFIQLGATFAIFNPIFAKFSLDYKQFTYKKIVIPFLTSKKTCHRVQYYIKSLITQSQEENSIISSYLISDSTEALSTAPAGVLSANCTGGRMSANGNACRFDMTFRLFYENSTSPWLLVAIDDTYLIMKNLYRLIHSLEMLYNPFQDQIMVGQVHHDWGTFFPHGGPGLLFSRGWVNEFFRQNMSFETIHFNNYRYTYDIAAGLLALNYFPNSIWIDYPWIIVVMPEETSVKALVTSNWSLLSKCRSKWGHLPRLNDVAHVHLSPFEKNNNYLAAPMIEQAPDYIKVLRPASYSIRFCVQNDVSNDILISPSSISKFVLNLTKLNARDVAKRIQKNKSILPL